LFWYSAICKKANAIPENFLVVPPVTRGFGGAEASLGDKKGGLGIPMSSFSILGDTTKI